MASQLERSRPKEPRHHREKQEEGFFQKLFREPGSLFGKSSTGPAMDLIDRSNELVVRADLPGLDENDISVEVEGRTLTIWGERHEAREERDESYYFCERWEGSFRRSLELPEGIDPQHASATFDHGVLEVCFPKTEPKTRGRRIEIGQGAGVGKAREPARMATEPAEEGAKAYEPTTEGTKPYEGGARRIEVTEPSGAPSSKVVTPSHTPGEDLGRH